MKTNGKKMRALFAALAIVVAPSLYISCSKSNSVTPGTSSAGYNMYMTDAPARAYQQINVNLTGAMVYSSTLGWMNLTTHAGIYDLLTLSNGSTALIANGQISPGTISQVRLELASSGNTVKVNDTMYPLTLASDQSGLTLSVNQSLAGGSSYNLLIDFDAGQSVTANGNTYVLKPVLRTVNGASSGSISGTISPSSAECQVMASVPGSFLTVSTFSTFSSISNGKFLIQGVASGNYIITITPPPPYSIQTMSNINVSNGQLTNIGTITLQ